MDVASILVGTVLGVALGVLASFLRPVAGWLERVGRATFRENPLIIHVENDPVAIWAGQPDWEPFAMYFRSLDTVTIPPEGRSEWLAWARANGGVDAGVTKLQVTLQAKTDVAVVVDAIRVLSSSLPLTEGVIVWRPTGGADLESRRFHVDLMWGDEPVVTYQPGPGLEERAHSIPAMKLAAGDIERFQIWAEATNGWHEWSLELSLLVEGRRQKRKILNDGAPFVTVGPDELTNLLHEPESGWHDITDDR